MAIGLYRNSWLCSAKFLWTTPAFIKTSVWEFQSIKPMTSLYSMINSVFNMPRPDKKCIFNLTFVNRTKWRKNLIKPNRLIDSFNGFR